MSLMPARSIPLICHVIVDLDVGGAELMLKRLVESSGGGGRFRHMVVSLTTIGSVGREIQALGLEVESLGLSSPLKAPAVVWKLAVLIRKCHPEIVQTWMYHADLLGGLAARLAGVRNVVWGIRTTDLSTGRWSATVVIRHMCARLSRWIPRVIVCAAESSRRVHVALGYDALRMALVPNGFDFPQTFQTSAGRSNFRTSVGLSSDDLFVVGSLGRFSPDKDHSNLIAAVTLLLPNYSHVRILMVGRGLDQENRLLAELIAATGYADRFVLLGERGDVPDCLSAMDVFCLHSRTEAFPNVLAEAMAMGLPSVTTDVGDAAAILGTNGLVVPKQDPMALARGLERIINMSSIERKNLGQQAKERIQQAFSMHRARERFEAVYASMLDQEEFD